MFQLALATRLAAEFMEAHWLREAHGECSLPVHPSKPPIIPVDWASGCEATPGRAV